MLAGLLISVPPSPPPLLPPSARVHFFSRQLLPFGPFADERQRYVELARRLRVKRSVGPPIPYLSFPLRLFFSFIFFNSLRRISTCNRELCNGWQDTHSRLCGAPLFCQAQVCSSARPQNADLLSPPLCLPANGNSFRAGPVKT